MANRFGKPRRRGCPLDEDLILSWADEHFEKYGVWPNLNSGQVDGRDEEAWVNINVALRVGHRGLLLGSSLAILLYERRGALCRSYRPTLTVDDVLLWADRHMEVHGRYPTIDDGIIEAAPKENWNAINVALEMGFRGLSKGSSLARVLQEHRNHRNPRGLPKLTLEDILVWADEHYQRTGRWPTRTSGIVQAAPGERWSAVETALVKGIRGLSGDITLTRLLIQYRGIKDVRNLPPYNIEEITGWLRKYAARHGKYPSSKAGTIEDAPEGTWDTLEKALILGNRGLPGGSSLSKLKRELIRAGKLPNLKGVRWSDKSDGH